MKLYSGVTYWDKKQSSYESHLSLADNIKTKILIVGGGMSGNLAAYILSKRGHQVVVVDKDKLGSGSSTANTGMLQYSSDMMLTEFIQSIGEKKAVLFYQMCLEAMKDLTSLNYDLDYDGDYILRDSIYYASQKDDVNNLIHEYESLKKHGFPVEFLEQEQLEKEYDINKGAALKTWFDAEVNPYKFIQAIVQKNKSRGVTYSKTLIFSSMKLKVGQPLPVKAIQLSLTRLSWQRATQRFTSVLKIKPKSKEPMPSPLPPPQINHGKMM